MRFASFLSGGFITAILVNPPERKQAKRNSVHSRAGVWELIIMFLTDYIKVLKAAYLLAEAYFGPWQYPEDPGLQTAQVLRPGSPDNYSWDPWILANHYVNY